MMNDMMPPSPDGGGAGISPRMALPTRKKHKSWEDDKLFSDKI
jgi:hypothetical protein